MKHIYALLYLVGQVLALSGQCPETLVIQLDSTAIRNLQSTPIQAIQQPVSGHYIQVMGMEVNVTSQYTNSPLLIAYHLGSSEGAFFSVGLYSGEPFYSGWPPINGGEIVADAPVMLTVSDSAIGNGSATIMITYRVVLLTNPTVCQTDTSSSPSTTGGLCYDIIHVTNAQLLDLFDNPVTLLPAPPQGKYINVLSASININGGTPYAGDGTVLLMYFSDSTKPVWLNASALPSNDTDRYSFEPNQGVIKSAAPLRLASQISNATAGTGDADITVVYKILDEAVGGCSGGGLLETVIDSVVDLTTDSVNLQTNKAILVIADGASVNIIFNFPAGVDDDIITVILTQPLLNVILNGVGITTITPRRIDQLKDFGEITFRYKNGGWN